MEFKKQFMNLLFRLKATDNLILTVIFITGLILRFINIPGEWMPDSARDLLFVKNIVINRQYPISGPFAMGINLFYPPFYYYFISFPYLFYAKPISIYMSIVLIQSLSIFFYYGIGKMLLSKKTTLLASFFYAVSYSSVIYGSTLWQTYIIIPFSLASCYFLLRFTANKKIGFFRISVLLTFLAGYIHYSALALLPSLILWVFIKKTLNLKRIFTNLSVLIFIFLLLNFSNLLRMGPEFQTQANNFAGIIQFLNWVRTNYLNFGKLPVNFILYIQSIIVYNPAKISLTTILFAFSLIITFYKFNKVQLSNLVFPIIIITNYIIITPLVENQCCRHFYTAASPFAYFIFAYALLKLFSSMSFIPLKFIFTTMGIVFYLTIFSGDKLIFKNYYNQINSAAGIIANDASILKKEFKSNDWNFFQSFYFQDYETNDSTLIWYFLERHLNADLIKIEKSNLVQTGDNDYIYLLCRRSGTPGCLRRVNELFTKNFKSLIIWENNEYAIYRFQKKYN